MYAVSEAGWGVMLNLGHGEDAVHGYDSRHWLKVSEAQLETVVVKNLWREMTS